MHRSEMTFAQRFLALGLLALGVPVMAQAQSAAPPPPPKYTDVRPVPDTPALRRAQEVVAALNSGDPAKVKALVETDRKSGAEGKSEGSRGTRIDHRGT